MQQDEPTSVLRLVRDAPGGPNTPISASNAAHGSVAPGVSHSSVRLPVLLATKLRLPPAYHVVIARARLLDLLDQGLQRAVTIIAAPAGFGKTTLLGDWSRQAGRPMAWVSLDEGDDDPTRFWSYAIAALDQVHTGAGAGALALLQSPQPPPIDAVLTVLINDLAAIEQGVTLVLDDYHLIDTSAIHQGVAFLIDHLPPQAHVVLTARAEPPLPLARWRARGQLQELRASDLRFHADEAAAFLAESMGLQLSGQEAAQLADRTEGWIAGLQLIAISLQRQGDIDRVVRELSGTQRFILDYLADEVLARQSPRVKAFLLHTSILERMNGALCDAVTGDADGQAVLGELERANLFVVPLDEERRWYRYHHLFAEFLRGRLQAQDSHLAATLHHRAAQWYEAQGLPGDAIGHALAGGEYAAAADLIEQVGRVRLMGGELATLRRWLDQLPDEIVGSRPRLSLLYAWLVTFGFHAEEAERHLRRAELAIAALADDALRRSLLKEVAAIRATGAATQIDLARLQSLAGVEDVQGREGDDSSDFLQGVRHLNRAMALEFSGNIAASNRAYREASASSQASGNVVIAVLALSQLGDQYVAQGRLHRAVEMYRQGLRLAGEGPDPGERPATPLAAMVHFGLATVTIERDDLEAAAGHVQTALVQARQLGNSLILTGTYVALARLQQVNDDHSAALETFDRAAEGARGSDLGWLMLDYLDAMRVRSWIAQGALTRVEDWIERRQVRAEQSVVGDTRLVQMEALDKMALLRALIALGRPREALELAAPLHGTFEEVGLSGILIELLALEALAHDALGAQAPALAALSKSLALAAPEGYVRLYADAGTPMARLLAQLRRSATPHGVPSVHPDTAHLDAAYLDRLIAACVRPPQQGPAPASTLPVTPGSAPPIVLGGAPPVTPGGAPSSTPAAGVPASPRGAPLIEPLSEREREVLRLVAAGLTNQEIATTLIVEVSTVKTHLLRLYGKLGVHSRTQALSRAREWQLLP